MNNLVKVSISIPQYNRINYLLKSLKIIEQQTYPNIEIVISDDCSTDDTVAEIQILMKDYKYPIVFDVNAQNMGYDRNYRKSIEMASGDYCIVLGNDDSLNGNDSIQFLVDFLVAQNFPEIGFSNFIKEGGKNIIQRASGNLVIGSGPEVALNYYSCFSFVGGLIYKRTTFIAHNTAQYDGSIYAQMYLGVYMIAKGATLFSIEKPLIVSDVIIDGHTRNSYKETIARKWKDYKVVNGGLPSVIHVIISALRDAGVLKQKHIFRIFRRIYSITYPHWILDYKSNNALPEAVGLVVGLSPQKNKNFKLLSLKNRSLIGFIYFSASLGALVTPVFLFEKVKNKMYRFFKK